MKFHEELIAAINAWNKDPIVDEFVFTDFRSAITGNMSSIEAFDSIGLAINELLQQNDESTATEIMQTIITLARHSNTTEIPHDLIENERSITERFMRYGDYAQRKLNELFKYYRMDNK